jgi:surface antigen
MRKPIAYGLTGLAMLAAAPALAQSRDDFGFDAREPGRGAELAPYLQCVPYAREVSGIRLFGDAHTWWQQAEGRYATGSAPRVGAVMAFRPHRAMQLGHVAAVSRVVDDRTVLLDHANWSPIDGRRGQIERDVIAVDVSPANDWSAVRVWYHPLGALGKTEWPVEGFIYADRARDAPVRVAQAVAQGPTRLTSSRRFMSAFNEFSN